MKSIEFQLQDDYMGEGVTARVVDWPRIKGGKDRLKSADEVVAPFEKVNVLFDYPLRKPEIFTLRTADKAGFTRLELFRAVHETYVAIYKNQEKYKVHSHGIADLYLEAALIEDDGSVKLVMGS